MPTQDEIRKALLEDIDRWAVDVLSYEMAFRDHLRWTILRRMIRGETLINPATNKPLKHYTIEDLRKVIGEMELETSKDLKRIHEKYLW